MKIGFIGTSIRMEIVRKILAEYFPEVEAEIYVDEGYIFSSKTADYLVRMRENIDGMVFGGELQYEIYQDIFSGRVPCTHIRKDSSSLINALLSLAQKKVDITKISVDNFSYATIRQIMEDAGVEKNDIIILRRRAFRSNEEKYYEDLFRQHMELYRAGKTTGCATTLSFVYDRLCAEGIPATYLRPTTDNIVKTINRIHELYREKLQKKDGRLAVLLLRLTPRDEVAYQFQSEYIESHEKLKAAEEIHYFAKSAGATVITQSDDQFTIIMNRSALMEYTNELQAFPLLHFIRDNSECDFSLGIGFGDTPGDARMNAVMALKKACQVPKSGTYIVYNNKSVTGPVEFVSQSGGSSVWERELFSSLSKSTGISEDKISRLYMMLERKKKPFFTVNELSAYLNISVRAANRIANALEENGLVKVVGQTNKGKVGRPGNLYEFLFVGKE